MLLCVAEVGLRISRHRTANATTTLSGQVPSRLTMYELPPLSILRKDDAARPVDIRVNSLGFRGPEISARKAEGTLRIVCLGDETTLGLHLPEDEIYPGQLASQLAQKTGWSIEVLNAGVPQGCPLTSLVRLRQHLDRIKPDVVLLHVDVSDALDDRRCRPHVRVDDAGHPIAVMHPSCRAKSHSWTELEGDFAVLAWVRSRLTRELLAERDEPPSVTFRESLAAWPSGKSLEESDVLPAALSPLLELREVSQSVGAEFVISTCPNDWQCAQLLRSSEGNASAGEDARTLLRRPSAAVHRAATDGNIPFVDATAAFLSAPDPASLYDRATGQLSAAGHALYSQVLVDFLTGGPQR